MSVWYCRQEGWRLERENVDDANSPIILKGVVFNEMKGVFVSKVIYRRCTCIKEQ